MSFSPEERDRELSRNIVEALDYIKRYTDGISKAEFMRMSTLMLK